MMDANTNLRVQEEADRWFARLLAPDCDAGQREAFERWRQVAGHALAYAERERLWQRFGAADAAADPRLRALRERVLARTASVPTTEGVSTAGPDLREVLATLPPRIRPAPTRRRWQDAWSVAIAAGVCAVAVGMGLRFIHEAPPETIYASAEALREVDLEDGTRLQLDVGTELTVRYGDDRRMVTLRHGRALFNVAHDAARPFRVDLGDSRLTVLGTRFQVSRDPDRVRVTLDSGSLQFDGGTETDTRSERLVPGEQISYSPQAPSVWDRRRVDSAVATAWSRGRLVFRATPLAEAVDEVNRYAHPKLRLADPSLSSLPVSGNFIAGDSVLVAETWAATLPLRAQNNGDEIILQLAHQ